jgi:uncharacterized membrane protein YfcA
MLDLTGIALLLGAGFLGGAINAIAGGATFFTFPAMMTAGLSPVMANASNTVALAPSSFTAFVAMRRYLPRRAHLLASFLALGLVGGALGAWLVLWLGDERFRAAVPYLLLAATALFAAGPWLVRTLNAASSRGRVGAMKLISYFVQAVTGIYGGFFGAGMGMVTLASLTLQGFHDVREMNALKNLFVSLCNGVAIIVFLSADAVSWPHALVMMIAGIAGGFTGGKIGTRLPPAHARRVVIAIGTILTIVYFIEG